MAHLNIKLFGGFEIQSASSQALAIKGRKSRALLAYLASPPGELRHEDGQRDGLSMRRSFLACITAVGLGLSLMSSVDASQAVTLRWFGHAFFLITSSDSRCSFDPNGEGPSTNFPSAPLAQ